MFSRLNSVESGFPGKGTGEEVSGRDTGSSLTVVLALILYVRTIHKFLFEESVQLFKEMFPCFKSERNPILEGFNVTLRLWICNKDFLRT